MGTPVTERFDLRNPEESTQLVNSLMPKTGADAIIDKNRRGMFGQRSFLKSLAEGDKVSEKRMHEMMDYFRAAAAGDNVYMDREAQKFESQAQAMVNEGRMTMAEYKVLAPWNETTASAGGYSVPPEYAADLARNLMETTIARRHFRDWGMTRNKTNVPGVLTKPSVSIVAENSTIPSSKPVEDNTLLTAGKVAAIFVSTNEALQDSNIETFAVMQDIFREQFQIFEDTNALQNANTTWNGLLWYGAGAITSGVAANGALAVSRTGLSTGGKTGYPQITDAAAANDAWTDLAYVLQAQPSGYYTGAKFFIDQQVAVAMLSMRDSQFRFLGDIVNGLTYEVGLDGQPLMRFRGYEMVIVPKGIMLTYDASAHVSTPFTAFCNPTKSWVMFGQRGGFIIKQLEEATLESVSLGGNDLTGIRMTERIAFGVARPDTVTILRTDAS